MESLRDALEYLYVSAVRSDLGLTAQLIGAAVESLTEKVSGARTEGTNGHHLKIGA